MTDKNVKKIVIALLSSVVIAFISFVLFLFVFMVIWKLQEDSEHPSMPIGPFLFSIFFSLIVYAVSAYLIIRNYDILKGRLTRRIRH